MNELEVRCYIRAVIIDLAEDIVVSVAHDVVANAELQAERTALERERHAAWRERLLAVGATAG